ncbi:type II secretion system F family protein [Pseudonocardia sp. DSM 110487]|uniref:type II secretion system F family protein n=1 Tax=Pseudonocardia sp. DSM 110487 TaxID=2865833 RepID=UPI001C698830|nr:type II secretion system F family protein [Pseudonocardia sp. DSM 110487]QYN36139.1 type II secretion system F family protein [Pseudonocardia sp. DSM 110487]
MTGGPPVPSGQVVALALLAAALLVGGTRHGRLRLRALQTPPAQPAPEGPPVRPTWVAVGAAAAGALGWAAAGATAGLLLAAATAGAGVLATRRGGRPGGALAPEPDTDLAAGWELLAVCLEAGLPVALAVTAAAEPLRGVVGARLRRTAGLLELGADASAAWLAAEQLPALATFARAAGRSAGTGSALAQVARAEAERIRAGLLDTAQAKAQRAAVLITAPLGVCFLPAFMVLGIAPVVVGLAGEVLANW